MFTYSRMHEVLRLESLELARVLHERDPCIKGRNNCIRFEYECCEFHVCPNSPENRRRGNGEVNCYGVRDDWENLRREI